MSDTAKIFLKYIIFFLNRNKCWKFLSFNPPISDGTTTERAGARLIRNNSERGEQVEENIQCNKKTPLDVLVHLLHLRSFFLA